MPLDRQRAARLLLAALLLLALWWLPRLALAAERLQITDPYLEVRTGPGRGYPITQVAARHEWIEVLLRYTDWYKVRTERGHEGWVHRQQLLSTLTDAGAKVTFREVLLDDYLKRRFEMGAAYGRFDSEPMLKVWTAYRFTDAVSVEATIGQVQGIFSGTDFWHLSINAEPWSDRRLSPFFGVGVGRVKNIPNESLVGATVTDANLSTATIGLRYHLSERFVARVDYSLYTANVADTRNEEYRAATIGISFFF